MPSENSTPTSISRAIFTTFENWTAFSAALCRSSIEKIFSPELFTCGRVSPDQAKRNKRKAYQFVCLFHISPLQSTNNGRPQIHLLHDVDQPLCNRVASHDTAEDVDKDRRHFRIARDQIKSVLDCLRSGTSTNVEEVGRRSTVELDDIHGRHGQTGTVDQAANVTVQFDEVKAVPRML